jgi:hypothetical protein
LFTTAPLTSPIAVSGTAPNSKIPVVIDYLLGIQRDISRGFVLTSQYVGNTQHYVLENYNYNLIPFGAQFAPQNIDPTSSSGAPPERFSGTFDARLYQHDDQRSVREDEVRLVAEHGSSPVRVRSGNRWQFHLGESLRVQHLEPGSSR